MSSAARRRPTRWLSAHQVVELAIAGADVRGTQGSDRGAQRIAALSIVGIAAPMLLRRRSSSSQPGLFARPLRSDFTSLGGVKELELARSVAQICCGAEEDSRARRIRRR
jgi:hypothetical protein